MENTSPVETASPAPGTGEGTPRHELPDGTRWPELPDGNKKPLVAIDFGRKSGKLALFGEQVAGAVAKKMSPPKLERKKPGTGPRSDAETFIAVLSILLRSHVVVTESATIGSSGAEADAVDELIKDGEGPLLLLPTRAVKNWVADNGLSSLAEATATSPGPSSGTSTKSRPTWTDEQSAQIQYTIATTTPASLRIYKGKDPGRPVRRYRSVRPSDKRGYRGDYDGHDIADWLRLLPDIGALGEITDEKSGESLDLRELVAPKGAYIPAQVLPLALALAEPTATSREKYEHVLGLYGHGAPSFYRRCTITLMQKIAKLITGRKKMSGVDQVNRKVAWRLARKTVRYLYANADKAAAAKLRADLTGSGCGTSATTVAARSSAGPIRHSGNLDNK